MVNYLILINQHGIIRYQRQFKPFQSKASEFRQFIKDLYLNLNKRKEEEGPFFEIENFGLIGFKKFGNLWFVAGIDSNENEFEILQLLEHIMEIWNLTFENFCELDMVRDIVKMNLVIEEIFNQDGEIITTNPILCLAPIVNLDTR